MKFSQRLGIVPAEKPLQIESIDKDLKNGLWNVYSGSLIAEIKAYGEQTTFAGIVWHSYFKENLDDLRGFENFMDTSRNYFFQKAKWFEIYDFIQFSAEAVENYFWQDIKIDEFYERTNVILEQEFSAYRFIDKQLSPITNQNEISEIESAIGTSNNFTALLGCNIHLKEALSKLSDRQKPDYRNSIKESISAIESISKVISGRSSDTLGGALTIVKDKIGLHPSLERGFKQLYGYTSDSDGIRHSLMAEPTCDFEDAKYMLVSSSAFINYLIAKANKAGISFT